jgi:hypothetical protein
MHVGCFKKQAGKWDYWIEALLIHKSKEKTTPIQEKLEDILTIFIKIKDCICKMKNTKNWNKNTVLVCQKNKTTQFCYLFVPGWFIKKKRLFLIDLPIYSLFIGL